MSPVSTGSKHPARAPCFSGTTGGGFTQKSCIFIPAGLVAAHAAVRSEWRHDGHHGEFRLASRNEKLHESCPASHRRCKTDARRYRTKTNRNEQPWALAGWDVLVGRMTILASLAQAFLQQKVREPHREIGGALVGCRTSIMLTIMLIN